MQGRGIEEGGGEESLQSGERITTIRIIKRMLFLIVGGWRPALSRRVSICESARTNEGGNASIGNSNHDGEKERAREAKQKWLLGRE
jgi:hypothetical protein